MSHHIYPRQYSIEFFNPKQRNTNFNFVKLKIDSSEFIGLIYLNNLTIKLITYNKCLHNYGHF